MKNFILNNDIALLFLIYFTFLSDRTGGIIPLIHYLVLLRKNKKNLLGLNEYNRNRIEEIIKYISNREINLRDKNLIVSDIFSMVYESERDNKNIEFVLGRDFYKFSHNTITSLLESYSKISLLYNNFIVFFADLFLIIIITFLLKLSFSKSFIFALNNTISYADLIYLCLYFIIEKKISSEYHNKWLLTKDENVKTERQNKLAKVLIAQLIILVLIIFYYFKISENILICFNINILLPALIFIFIIIAIFELKEIWSILY